MDNQAKQTFERRRSPRVELKGLDDGPARHGLAKIVDISACGAQVEFPQRLEPGTAYELRLTFGDRQILARAVVTRPNLILADEPTGNLDSAHGEEIMNALAELNENGTTIVMVTHSPTYAAYGRRTVHLFDGHVVTEQIAATATLS